MTKKKNKSLRILLPVLLIVALAAPFLGVFGDIRGMRKKLPGCMPTIWCARMWPGSGAAAPSTPW
jgi:hypothetical protein